MSPKVTDDPLPFHQRNDSTFHYINSSTIKGKHENSKKRLMLHEGYNFSYISHICQVDCSTLYRFEGYIISLQKTSMG
jgi:hypothetical protein